MNTVKASKEGKKVFNDLNKLIIDINNNNVNKKDAVERLTKSISDLDQLKQKQSTAFQNKLIHVIYQLFNPFGFNKESAPLSSQIKSQQTEEEMQIPLFIQKESEQSKEEMQIPLSFKTNKPEFDELTSNIFAIIKIIKILKLL